MNLDRRTFIKSSSLFLGGILLQGHKSLSSLRFDDENFRVIRKNFGLYNENGGTIAWYVNDDSVVVIDSQFPDSVKNFITDLKTKTSNKINFLFNTHHHRDHTMGNFVLREITDKIVSQTNCPRLQIKQSKGAEDEKMVVTADITFDDEMLIKLPKENVKSQFFGAAHTGGDITIHFENLNIAHLGDLVFNKVYPYIDNFGEGSVSGWIEVLEKVYNYFDTDTKFVFGHANINENVFGDKSAIMNMKNYLIALNNYVTEKVKNGMTPDQVAETNTVPGFDDKVEMWKGARKMNLKAAAEQIKI
jgi:cyclase